MKVAANRYGNFVDVFTVHDSSSCRCRLLYSMRVFCYIGAGVGRVSVCIRRLRFTLLLVLSPPRALDNVGDTCMKAAAAGVVNSGVLTMHDILSVRCRLLYSMRAFCRLGSGVDRVSTYFVCLPGFIFFSVVFGKKNKLVLVLVSAERGTFL